MDRKANQKLQQMTARDTVKIRRVDNGYIINSENGMRIAGSLKEVITFLEEMFGKTVDTK
jgi:hypothetical protein